MADFVNVASKGLQAAGTAVAAYQGAKKGLRGIKKAKKTIPKIPAAIKKAPHTFKEKLHKAKYAASVGKAGVQLAGRMLNPVNIAKTAKNAATGKGLVLPGSKYIGPGNSMDKGAPTSQADANAYQHDVDYDNYMKKGKLGKKSVYLGYSDADERLLKNTKANTPEGLAVNLGMLAKKGLNKLGLTRRVRDKDVYGKGGPPDQGAKPPSREKPNVQVRPIPQRRPALESSRPAP